MTAAVCGRGEVAYDEARQLAARAALDEELAPQRGGHLAGAAFVEVFHHGGGRFMLQGEEHERFPVFLD